MYQGSADFIAANASIIQKHKIRGIIGTTSFDGDNLLDLTITKKNSDGSDIKVGAVYISELKATFLKNIPILPRGWVGKRMFVEFGLCVSENPDVYEWMPMGEYTIAQASITLEGTSIVAYDDLAKFDELLPDSLTLTGNLYQILTRVCNRCGVVLGMTALECQNLPNGTQPLGLYSPNDCHTFRDIIYWLSQLVGGWAECDRYGRFVLRTYPRTHTPVSTLTEMVLVSDASFSSWVTSFGSCIFINEDDSSSFYGSTGVGLCYQCGMNPFMIYGTQATKDAMRTEVLDSLASITYQPFKVSLMSSPVYDLGDIIYFDGDIAGSESYNGIVNSIEFRVNQGFTISGFGANPNLQSVQSESEKASASARSSSSDKETEYTITTNTTAITVGSSPVKVADILFSANKPTVVETWHEFQLETNPDEGESLQLEATYYLDLVEVARKPIETYADAAKHIMDLHYATRIQDAGSHQWTVYLTATGGTATIDVEGALNVLKGQGLAKQEAWSGVIVLDDTVTAFSIVAGVMTLTELVKCENRELDYRKQFAESILGIISELPTEELNENVVITFHYGDHVNFCGENYYMGTEGVLL